MGGIVTGVWGPARLGPLGTALTSASFWLLASFWHPSIRRAVDSALSDSSLHCREQPHTDVFLLLSGGFLRSTLPEGGQLDGRVPALL